MPADLEQLSKAFHKKDFALVEKIAHKIKGETIYIGTIRVKYACQYLERYWKTGEHALIEKLYYQSIDVIEDTCAHITTWLKKSL
ncbi:MAG: Hpt domain-containing protein [Legionella sp.]|nr:Hpt domain-containing protein [Legionella sp.]